MGAMAWPNPRMALARFCAPWLLIAGEKGKNALGNQVDSLLRSAGAGRSRSQQARAFFPLSPFAASRGKKRAKAMRRRRSTDTVWTCALQRVEP